jgi:hypothetical protein
MLLLQEGRKDEAQKPPKNNYFPEIRKRRIEKYISLVFDRDNYVTFLNRNSDKQKLHFVSEIQSISFRGNLIVKIL